MTEYKPIPPYEGNDMAGFMMERGFKLHDPLERIISITNVRDTAIIVTDRTIWRAYPMRESGFAIQTLAYLTY